MTDKSLEQKARQFAEEILHVLGFNEYAGTADDLPNVEKQLLAFARHLSAWVPVTERLPQPDERVQLLLERTSLRARQRYRVELDGLRGTNGGLYKFPNYRIIAWQSTGALPSPPQNDKEEV